MPICRTMGMCISAVEVVHRKSSERRIEPGEQQRAWTPSTPISAGALPSSGKS